MIAYLQAKSVTISIDLGSGVDIRNPFDADKVIGIDIIDAENVINHNLFSGTIPLPDESVDFVTAHDFIEHVPRQQYFVGGSFVDNPFISLMNEISRVLKRDGMFMHKTPAYPHQEVFMDPTHVNFITEKTMIYFAKVLTENGDDVYDFLRPIALAYGVNTSLKLTYSAWDSFHLIQHLQKI